MARPAGVHHRYRPVHELEQRPVRVPVYDDLGPGKRRMQILRRRMAELVAMRHDDGEPIELELRHLWQTRSQLGPVRVPVDRRHRRDRLELDEDLGLADVAGMKDVINLLEHLEHFRAQETVGI